MHPTLVFNTRQFYLGEQQVNGLSTKEHFVPCFMNGRNVSVGEVWICI
jgi:hypothetical protein